MQVANPFQMNDWKTKRFLAVVLTVQVAMFALIGLELIGLDVPVLRQLVGGIYLLFIPGVIILRLFKVHNLHAVEGLLYSVGLSIAFLMFLGFAINSLYPLFGISQPLSKLPLMATLGIVLLLLTIASCWRSSGLTQPASLHLKLLISPPFLFLVFLVLLTVVGAQQITYGDSVILLLVLLLLVALIPIFVAFNKFIPGELYAFAIFVIALTLLFQASFMSPYLTHQDIHREYYATSLVLTNFHWDSTIYMESENGLLSITMLPVFCSLFLKMDIVWLFKIIYPLIFALVPLGVFQLFRKQNLGLNVSFLAAFFFLAFTAIFIRMPGLPRQEIAELFFILVILLISAREMGKVTKSALALIFVVSVVVSHYGVSYALIVYVLIGWLGILVLRNYSGLLAKVGIFRAEGNLSSNIKTDEPPSTILTGTFAVFCVVTTLAWFMNVTEGLGFTNLVQLSNDILDNIWSDLFNLGARDAMVALALGGAPTTPTIWREIHRFVQYATQILIIVGVLYTVFKWKEGKLERHFAVMALASSLVLMASIIVPRFTMRISLIRVYHIALFFLAPFCILGMEIIVNWIRRLARHKASRTKNNILYQKLFLIVLIPYFLFNIGFIYELAHDPPMENPVRMLTMKNYERGRPQAAFYNTYVPEQDVFSARWLSEVRVKGHTVYADCNAYPHVLASYGNMDIRREARILSGSQECGRAPYTHIWSESLREEHYIYLGYFNVVSDKFPNFPEQVGGFVIFDLSDLAPAFENRAKIYSNGGSEIYYGKAG